MYFWLNHNRFVSFVQYQRFLKKCLWFFLVIKMGLWFKEDVKKINAHIYWISIVVQSDDKMCDGFHLCYRSENCSRQCVWLFVYFEANEQVKEKIDETNERKHNLCHTINRFVYIGCSHARSAKQNSSVLTLTFDDPHTIQKNKMC